VLSVPLRRHIGLADRLLIKRRFLGFMTFFLLWIGSIALSAYHLYTDPQIFLYNPFIGFFSGAIYDEVINITWTFVIYRSYNLLIVFINPSIGYSSP